MKNDIIKKYIENKVVREGIVTGVSPTSPRPPVQPNNKNSYSNQLNKQKEKAAKDNEKRQKDLEKLNAETKEDNV